MIGKNNIAFGFLAIGLFMIFGFILIYLRDFAPGAVEWATSYSNGKHFEARLAHVHGGLFSFINIVVGFLLMQLRLPLHLKKWISWTSLIGLLMPTGIVMELLFGAPPLFVLLGGLSMTVSMLLFGWAAYFKLES